MKLKNITKLIILAIMLIAIINIMSAVNLLLNRTAFQIYTNFIIMVIITQILSIIIASVILKKNTSKSTEKLLIVLLIIIMIITFFIPVKTNLKFPESSGGLTPAVMPQKVKQNLYNIIIDNLYYMF